MQNLSKQDTYFTLGGILLALFLGALDQTIVSTALPKIVEDLHGLSRYAWVATVYLVASTVMVPVYGKLADMHSRKVIELWAVGLFLGGSFLCGLAGEFGPLPLVGDGMNQLIVFRAIQGLGGAGLFAMAFIIIADLFPPAERGRYQGLVGGVFGIASVLGPLVGGVLTDHGGHIIPGVAGWRWVFYVNLPFGILALWFIITRMPALNPHGEKKRFDYLSALLLLLGMVPLILALQIDKQQHPWQAPETLLLFALALGALTLFVFRSLHSANPILNLSLFKNKVFSRTSIALFLMGASFLNLIIFLPLFVVNVVGVSATSAGISLIPLSLGVVLGSTVAGQVVSRFGHYRRLMLLGGSILLVGIWLLSTMPVDIGYGQVTFYMVICGLGLGPTMPLYPLAIQNAVDVRVIGQATSAGQFFRQIGGAVGAAIMGTVLAVSLVMSFQHSMPAGAGAAAPAGGGHQVQAASRSFSGGMGQDSDSVARAVKDRFAAQYASIAQAVNAHDSAGLNRALQEAPVPPAVQARLKEAVTADADTSNVLLAELRQRLDEQAEAVVHQIEQARKKAFQTAITRIYFYVFFMVAAGWVATLFIPELPLRKTNAPTPQSSLQEST